MIGNLDPIIVMINSYYIRLALLFFFFLTLTHDVLGYTYEYYSNGLFTYIHVLIVDPNEHSISACKAKNLTAARETVKEMSQKEGAVAAINGGFWKLNGRPAGILKVQGSWYATPDKPRGAIGWTQNGRRVAIDRLLTNYSLEECWSESQLEVIPASNPPWTSASDWSDFENIVGGTPVLIKNGFLVEDSSAEQVLESFLTNRHPRTAIGIRPSGEWVFVVVDGRFYGYGGGMTISELADFMLYLGCTEALNLDGGGSSTMVLEGSVINEPCGEILEDDKYVQEVSDAILIH